MKKLIFNSVLCIATTLTVLPLSSIQISASEVNYNTDFPIAAKQNEVADDINVQPRGYIKYGEKKYIAGGISVAPYITYGSSGTIIDSGIVIYDKNDEYIVLYDVFYNATKTVASFTVTVYTKGFFGGIDSALGTKYWTIYSPGPRSIDGLENTIYFNLEKN